jgi:hypothetical protein
MLSPLPRFSPTKTQSVMFQKKPRACLPWARYHHPHLQTSSRESHPQPKWFNVAGPGRQNGAKVKSTWVALNTQGGVQNMLVMGSPHHWFPPKRNPKPRSAPRVRGFSCESAHVELLQTMQSAVGRNRPLGERLTGCPSCNRWQAA